ncbi:uncharacterized protein [Lepeophtheirus salmonis]|uniref:uncharacterized protein n=1 Tax=Lepeophtheirus salmonis TaxID=72036 RepID=UPI003AF3E60F
MGGFIFKLKLSDVEKVELVDKRGSLTLGICLSKDGRIWLRKPEDIREWFQIIKECVSASKERKGMMKSSKEFWSKKAFGDALLTSKEYVNNNKNNRPHSHFIPRRTTAGGLMKEYGFIDLPKAESGVGRSSLHIDARNTRFSSMDYKNGVENLVDDEDDTDKHLQHIAPPPPQYSSGTSCSKDSSESNKSRDSGIDSIAKTGPSGMVLCKSSVVGEGGLVDPPKSSNAQSKFGPRASDLVIYRHRTPSNTKKIWRRSDHCISDIVDEFPNIWVKNEEREIKASQKHRRYSHFIIPPHGMLGNGSATPQVTKL